MAKIETYISVEMLEEIFNSFPTGSFLDILFSPKQNEIDIYRSIYSLIFKRSFLLVNDYNSLVQKAKENPFFQLLINNRVSGGSEIYEDNDLENTVCKDDINPSALAYLNSSKLNPKCLLIDQNIWKEKTLSLSTFRSFIVNRNIDHNEFLGWSFLQNIKVPTNALVLTDNYILNEGDFKMNLFRILDGILPLSIENGLSFHLSFITSNRLDPAYVMSRLESIKVFVDSLRTNYETKVSIFLVAKNNLHDRDLITNYYRLKSGHSLNYYDRNGEIEKNTEVFFIGLNSMDNNPHENILQDLKNITQSCKVGIDKFGDDFENRLFR